MRVLITICARKGSKGLPSKNIRPLLGKPLLQYSIETALAWKHPAVQSKKIVVSTDCENIAKIAKDAGAEVPFLRPSELATDSAGKVPVIVHALQECELKYKESYDIVLDLDPTAPIRSANDLDQGLGVFLNTKSDICFSVTKARKNPYFNMVEKNESGEAKLCKTVSKSISSRQAAPQVWDMNASIYFYQGNFLRSKPTSLWEGKTSCFEMPIISAFDIDTEQDFIIVESLMGRL